MKADATMALMPSSNPKRGPNATPARITMKKMPALLPGRSTSRSKPAIAESTPRIATVAPFIVPRRTSSASAITTSAPIAAAHIGASPPCACATNELDGIQKG